jgi:hypothetical protein
MFIVSKKSNPQEIYAMKVTSKNTFTTEETEIRKLGNSCRFLVETKAAFVSKVNKLISSIRNKFIIKKISHLFL